MKKRYLEPQMIEAGLMEASMLAGSGVKGKVGTESIGYGGIDTDGSLDPEVKQDGGWFDN